jgi:hypothetical protein
MLHDEKDKLQKQFNDRKDLLEKKVRIENEERI